MKFWTRAVIAAGVALAISAAGASAATPPTKPSKINSLKATAGDSQVTLSWTSPTLGKPVTSYTVTASPGPYSTTETSEPRTALGLHNGTLYTFTVYANNSVGAGAKATVTATPRATPPSAPKNLGATQIGSGQIRLDWTPPTTNGSTPEGGTSPDITSYNIRISPGGSTTQVPGTTLTKTASGLADNITYTFTVTATNSRSLTGPAATVYAPLPTGASIGLQPSAGELKTNITVTGQLFLKNENVTLYWDVTTHVAANVVTDDNGAFTKVLKPRALDKPGVHKLCANVQPKPCANFTLRTAPTPLPSTAPSPDESPTPTPTDTPQASGPRLGGGGVSGLDFITRPPFVFLPIIGIIGLLGVLLYWLLSSRGRPTPTSSPTVVHRATRPHYMAPFPTAGAAPVAPQAPAQPSAWDAPVQAPPPIQPPPPPPAVQAPPTPYAPPPAPPLAAPPPPVEAPPTPFTPPPAALQATPPPPPPREVEWPAPPSPPAVPDEPPDLPQPSD